MAEGTLTVHVVRGARSALRLVLMAAGLLLGLLSLVLLGYATGALLLTHSMRWVGVIYGAVFHIKVIEVTWAVFSRRCLPALPSTERLEGVAQQRSHSRANLHQSGKV
jgi:hypothetical protein